MKLKKCPEKHFYDADKYDECPHCAKKVKKPSTEKREENTSNRTSDKTVSLSQASYQESSKTVYLPETESIAGGVSKTTQRTGNFTVPLFPEEDFPVQESEKIEKVSDFAREVAEKSASVHAMQNSGEKTVAFYNTGGTEPVVGWLVCVKGEYVGESFNLKEGQNFIGRSLGMDIALVNEKTVSREFHAGIIFDPVEKTFYAVPGHSNGLTYVNGSILFSALPLKAYDEIQLGKSLYVFMPFCGDSFSWDKYSEQ